MKKYEVNNIRNTEKALEDSHCGKDIESIGVWFNNMFRKEARV